jgi:hypothetical protein
MIDIFEFSYFLFEWWGMITPFLLWIEAIIAA